MARVILYSHDTFGLGHFRRCLKIAGCLAAGRDQIEGILITGSPWSRLFRLPRGFSAVTLPPVVKCGPRRYASRDGGSSFKAVAAQRRRLIEKTVADFVPDLLIVDNVPCGLAGEVMPALRQLGRRRGARAVLSLRDILDSPEAILSEWSDGGANEALEQLFDEIWVFGGQADVEVLVEEGPLAWAAEKVHACGRIGSALRSAGVPVDLGDRTQPTVLVTGGGGRDAAPLVSTYLEALRDHRPTVTSQVVLGPDYPVEGWPGLDSRARRYATIERFVGNMPDRIAASDVIVAMAGYNTVCEILEAGRPAVLIPRVEPRAEQLLRAQRWQRARRVKVIHPDSLDPTSLWRAVEEVLALPSPVPLRFDGGKVAAGRAAALLGA